MKQNTQQVVTFALIATEDGSAVTTGTATAYVTQDGGTQAEATNSPAHSGNGQWSLTLTAAETNAGSVGVLVTHADAIPVNLSLHPVAKVVSDLNDLSAAQVNEQVDTALADYDGPTKAELDSAVDGLSTFNPASDTVARVTLVDTVTTNSDMRGTDNAYTGTPPTAAEIRQEMDSNSAALAAIDAAIAALNDYDGSDTEGVTTLLSRLTATRAGYLDKLNVSGTLAHSDAASTYQADVSSLATQASVDAIAGNEGRSLDDLATPDDVSGGGGGDAPTTAEIAAAILATPDNKLATNADGSVNTSVTAEVDVDASEVAQAVVSAIENEGIDISFTAPFTTDGETFRVTATRGDGYTADSLLGPLLVVTLPVADYGNLTGASARFTATRDAKTLLSISGAIINPNTEDQAARIEATADDWLIENVRDGEQWDCDVEVTPADGEPFTIHGEMRVLEDQSK